MIVLSLFKFLLSFGGFSFTVYNIVVFSFILYCINKTHLAIDFINRKTKIICCFIVCSNHLFFIIRNGKSFHPTLLENTSIQMNHINIYIKDKDSCLLKDYYEHASPNPSDMMMNCSIWLQNSYRKRNKAWNQQQDLTLTSIN